ncbi:MULTISPECIES: BrnT family toxin [unclassified Aureimonas]|uniref:BrnT family toxin n=1 Tax=unclassified Aureimonas TaxID=2615206 RepID=UPI0006F6121D|nr:MULTISPECIES: BrnT family toxin [unclassified Aureimonas]KQT69923.1 hypothetical protein ASG62_02125 [Aureimonas sp. Leaf427]KQT75923.1 hypothetical protein ASG54_14095 [Aureimonas sp. Leaf460]
MTTDGAAFKWDPVKAASNLAAHGVPFDTVSDFDFETALIVIDGRHDYGEVRKIAFGFIQDRLHVLVYTERDTHIRVISLRKANDREGKLYGGSRKQTDQGG